jgi:hypothetical protein
MLTPERLFRLMIELIFVLLGFLVVWLGLVRHVSVDRHGDDKQFILPLLFFK